MRIYQNRGNYEHRYLSLHVANQYKVALNVITKSVYDIHDDSLLHKYLKLKQVTREINNYYMQLLHIKEYVLYIYCT